MHPAAIWLYSVAVKHNRPGEGRSMDNSKRKLAKLLGVSATGVLAWKQPVVDSVSLPAHAATTCGGDEPCCLPSGCYQFEPDLYVSWPGGAGPHQFVPGGHQLSDCSDTIPPQASWFALVIASSESAAQMAFNDFFGNSSCGVQPVPTQPAELGAGCTVYACLD